MLNFILVFIFILVVVFGLFLFINNSKKEDNNSSILELFEISDPVEFVNEIGFYYSNWDFSKLNDFEKTVSTIWELEAEVNNGGFHQYFSNSAGNNAIFTLESLEKVGSKKFKKILEDAILFFPENDFPVDRINRIEIMDKGNKEETERGFDKLDSRFSEYEEDIHKMIFDFCVKHKTNFR